ncbi:hypothetical protein EDD41_2725 [Luteococcus japonicus]|uniref:Leucine rich repeat (LRR) protein n=1 Tax=Luteococcus japonicus TaxID=33984 RepID=A0A3N1ZX78_9ACTN|nr:hypothetical protein [Luteococcus japonicus]ROR55451.1 hypothetical protein EDD41_2725 [Luteococcus japonicus]
MSTERVPATYLLGGVEHRLRLVEDGEVEPEVATEDASPAVRAAAQLRAAMLSAEWPHGTPREVLLHAQHNGNPEVLRDAFDELMRRGDELAAARMLTEDAPVDVLQRASVSGLSGVSAGARIQLWERGHLTGEELMTKGTVNERVATVRRIQKAAPELLTIAAQDPSPRVRRIAASAPQLPASAALVLARDADREVRLRLVQRPQSATREVIETVAGQASIERDAEMLWACRVCDPSLFEGLFGSLFDDLLDSLLGDGAA